MNLLKKQKTYGFTLVELLVVISIIALLSSIVLASLNSAREKARIARSVAQVRELIKVVALYYDDTGQYPSDCRLACNAANDPFLNSLGVSGWKGPYFTVYNLTHPWGGHIGFGSSTDLDGDGFTDIYIVLDDDAPGTNSSDNSGMIPVESLVKIDEILDDGDLTTGMVQGNDIAFFSSAAGEIVMIFRL
jgi:prepilin-type N-terminal cleavage/methylation domain-containing protein